MTDVTGTRSLEGKVAVVTGASRGLGRSAAVGLSRAGAKVVLVARNLPALDETKAAVEAERGEAMVIACDITAPDDVEEMAISANNALGQLDILVNNAGVAADCPFLELTPQDIRQTLDVNVFGMLLVSQAIGRRMVERKKGKIINIGSVDAVVGVPNLVHYCASKGAVAQFTRALAAEWAKFGVTVNCLCPGYFETEMNRDSLRDPLIGKKILRRVPMGRFGQLDEMVAWIVFLSTNSSDYATGQLFVIDGGESAR
jgi:NAD(P)-dependent dehydrogenase (short-subunit alcohol dehydrogenase family)